MKKIWETKDLWVEVGAITFDFYSIESKQRVWEIEITYSNLDWFTNFETESLGCHTIRSKAF